MPNWCENFVTIKGSKKHIDAIKSTKLDFNKIIPQPKEFEDDLGNICPMCNGKRTKKNKYTKWCKDCNICSNIGGRVSHFDENNLKYLSPNEIIIARQWIEKYGTCSWYDWSITNWGTKWNSSDVKFEKKSDNTINVSFITAWSPPLPILLEISRKYNCALNNDYNIEGNESGIMTIENGELL